MPPAVVVSSCSLENLRASGEGRCPSPSLGLKTPKVFEFLTRRQRKTEASSLDQGLVSLRFVLQDILFYSELDPAEVTEFNSLLGSSSELADIREAFLRVTDANVSADEARLLDHVYRRATDEDFVEGDDYASALMDETPRRTVCPLLRRLIEERQYSTKQEAYVKALWTVLTDDEVEEIANLLTVRLDEDTPRGAWAPNLRLVVAIGQSIWDRLSPAIRIRLESLITNDVLSGRYDIFGGGIKTGALGTYASVLFHLFGDQATLLNNIESMLHQSWYTQNYVAKYFMTTLPSLAQTVEDRRRLLDGLVAAVTNDARIIVNRLGDLPDDWVAEIQRRATE